WASTLCWWRKSNGYIFRLMPMFRTSSTLLALTLMCWPATARAQAASASVHPTAPPSAVATRRAGAIIIDGRLDDDAWRAAMPIAAFTQTQPDEWKPATQRTEMRILYDDDAL